MTTRSTRTPLNLQAAHVAYNIPHTLMAVVDHSGNISTFERDGQSRDWIAGPTWPLEGFPATCICWAPPEFGNVLCVGAMDSTVSIWAQTQDGQWTQRAKLALGAGAATAASFAPRQLGPLVAVSFVDGTVKIFAASSPLDADTWDQHSEVKADRNSGGCICLDWREYDPALPPLLVVGTRSGVAKIWMFRDQLLRWEGVSTIKTPQSIGAIAWAPRLGRPVDLIAVAAGKDVSLFSLTGAVDNLKLEKIADLQHNHDVWQVGWNVLGNWLAASTDGGEVCMWRPDLAGEWKLLNKIIGGGAPVEQNSQEMVS